MTPPIKRMTKYLGLWLGWMLTGLLGFGALEIYAMASGGEVALITTTVRYWWEQQPGAFLSAYLLLTLFAGILVGHLHWSKR